MADRILGEVTTLNGYAGMIAVFRARCDELGITGETCDALGGLTARHTSKLLTANHMKKFGPVSFGAIMGVLAIKFVAVVDEEAWAQIRKRITPAKYRRWNADRGMLTRKRQAKSSYYFSNPELARLARMRGILLMSAAHRQRVARNAALARWQRTPKR